MTDRLRRDAGRAAGRAPDPPVIARVGLGAMLLAAGAHKLVAPGAWTAYVAGWLAPWLLVPPTLFMLANGVLEIGFGAALVVDRWTGFAAAVAAISLSATAGYLAVVFLTEGRFGASLARDVGLVALAWTVFVDELR